MPRMSRILLVNRRNQSRMPILGFLEADRGTDAERVGEVRTGCLIVIC